MTEVTSARRGLGRYAELLAEPGLLAPVVLGVLARLPIGMTPLALLLLVQHRTGSFATAGLVSGAYTAALAVAAPVRGRSADRYGARRVLLRSGIVHPLALLGGLAAVLTGLPLVAVVPLVALAGLSFPPVGPVIRALWAVLVPESRLPTAYALDAVLVEIAFVSGPLLVALGVALGSPAIAVLLAALLVAVAGTAFASTTAVRSLAGDPLGGRSRLAGPLREPAVRRLLLAVLALGVGFGSTEVAVPSFATAQATPGVAGLLLAGWALGSACGGLGYGARDWGRTAGRQYPWLLGLLAVGLTLPVVAAAPWQLGALLLLGGAAIAPFGACNAVLLGRLSPAGAATESFAWSGTAIVAGLAIGNAATGWLVETAGARAGFLAAGAAGLLALAVGAGGHRGGA